MLAQNRDDLLFREPASLHLSILQMRAGLYRNRWKFPVAGQAAQDDRVAAAKVGALPELEAWASNC
jgi:hypothetical protein